MDKINTRIIIYAVLVLLGTFHVGALSPNPVVLLASSHKLTAPDTFKLNGAWKVMELNHLIGLQQNMVMYGIMQLQ